MLAHSPDSYWWDLDSHVALGQLRDTALDFRVFHASMAAFASRYHLIAACFINQTSCDIAGTHGDMALHDFTPLLRTAALF